MTRVAACVLLTACTCACSNRERERLKDTTQATYDPRSGRLTELTYDANKNGRIDTWTEMDGARPVRSRADRNEDGKPDRWEYYGADGKLTKVGMSRADDGEPDAWAYSGADGKVARIEISSSHDEKKIDRWEHYGPGNGADNGPLLSAEEDTNGDGRPDKWETYQAGSVNTVAFDEDHDGKADRRLTYANGALTQIETDPDATGSYRRQVPVK